jgi:threonine aldolase
MIDGCCDHAQRMAQALSRHDGVEVLNDVVLDQVVVRFEDSDAMTAEVIERVQQDGTCWLGGSTFRGQSVMRVSVVSWQTTPEDIDISAQAILACFESARHSVGSGASGAA